VDFAPGFETINITVKNQYKQYIIQVLFFGATL